MARTRNGSIPACVSVLAARPRWMMIIEVGQVATIADGNVIVCCLRQEENCIKGRPPIAGSVTLEMDHRTMAWGADKGCLEGSFDQTESTAHFYLPNSISKSSGCVQLEWRSILKHVAPRQRPYLLVSGWRPLTLAWDWSSGIWTTGTQSKFGKVHGHPSPKLVMACGPGRRWSVTSSANQTGDAMHCRNDIAGSVQYSPYYTAHLFAPQPTVRKP